MSKKKSLSTVPDDVLSLLNAEDGRLGFPKGTMHALMSQEVGGNFGKYLDKPDTYHYGLNGDGQRIAGHTGKISTAFGPFGILESTGKNPGFGVAPLKDKSLQEQIRFAADYLGGRVKASGGDLAKGLAGYGEGDKYAQQVLGRMGGQAGLGMQAPENITQSQPQPTNQPDQHPIFQFKQPQATPAQPYEGSWGQFQANQQPVNAQSMGMYGVSSADVMPQSYQLAQAPVQQMVGGEGGLGLQAKRIMAGFA